MNRNTTYNALIYKVSHTPSTMEGKNGIFVFISRWCKAILATPNPVFKIKIFLFEYSNWLLSIFETIPEKMKYIWIGLWLMCNKNFICICLGVCVFAALKLRLFLPHDHSIPHIIKRTQLEFQWFARYFFEWHARHMSNLWHFNEVTMP